MSVIKKEFFRTVVGLSKILIYSQKLVFVDFIVSFFLSNTAVNNQKSCKKGVNVALFVSLSLSIAFDNFCCQKSFKASKSRN